MKTSEKYLFMAILSEIIETSGLEPVFFGSSISVMYNESRFEIYPNFNIGFSFGVKVYDDAANVCAYSGEYSISEVTDFKNVLDHVKTHGRVYQEDMPF